jgi:Do/DeqQ family serine protease
MSRKWIFLFALLVLAVLAAVRWGGLIELNERQTVLEAPPRPPEGGAGFAGGFSALAALEEDYVRLVRSVVPSVVSITTQKTTRRAPVFAEDAFELIFGPRQRTVTERGLGSGVIVSEDGKILTNHHVIEGMQKIQVQFTDGRSESAQLVGSDPATDIAVLKIQGSVPALHFGDSDSVRVGQPVLAVGNPFGLQETVTQGIISAKGRVVRDSGVEFLQTDAAVNQGNSGGPLLNLKGQVIGINSAIYSANTGTWLGISFAIPANVARDSMESILRTGKVQRQTLGVSSTALTPEIARLLGLRAPVGALVTGVLPGSPAEKCGIQPGDIIAGVDGVLVQSPAALPKMLAGKKAGSRVKLSVVRDGSEYTVPCEVADAPTR